LTPNERFDQDVKRHVEARVREGVKAVLEEVLQEEMTEHLEAGSTGSSLRPGAASVTDTTPATSSHPRVRLSVLRCRATARASS